MLARVLVAVTLVAACGDKPEGGAVTSNAPVTSSPDDDVMERGIGSLAAISELATRHGANCDALARDLAVHAKQHAPQIAAFKKLLATNQQSLTTRYGERIQQVGKAAVLSLRDHCAKHPAITAMLKQLE